MFGTSNIHCWWLNKHLLILSPKVFLKVCNQSDIWSRAWNIEYVSLSRSSFSIQNYFYGAFVWFSFVNIILKRISLVLLYESNQNNDFFRPSEFKRQPHKMVKHTQTICQLLPTNCLIVFDDFVGLAFEGLVFSYTLKKWVKLIVFRWHVSK